MNFKNITVASLLGLSIISIPFGQSFASETTVIKDDTLSSQFINERKTVESAAKFFNFNGRNYTNYTSVINNSGLLTKGATTIVSDKSMSSGGMGAHSNLYDSSGKVVKTSNWGYTSTNSTGMTIYTDTNNKASIYFTRGTTRVYNGNGYNTYSANESPKMNVGTFKISNSDLEERQFLYDNYEMIAAIGENSVEGYVKIDDLYDLDNQPENPKEAIEYQNRMAKQKYKFIPIYDTDGVTKIGDYKINCAPEKNEF